MTAQPASDYVKQFIESADKTQVLTARQVMITHVYLVHEKDDPANALRQMQLAGFSSACVADGKMRLMGVVTAEATVSARQEGSPLAGKIERKVVQVRPDMLAADIAATVVAILRGDILIRSPGPYSELLAGTASPLGGASGLAFGFSLCKTSCRLSRIVAAPPSTQNRRPRKLLLNFCSDS